MQEQPDRSEDTKHQFRIRRTRQIWINLLVCLVFIAFVYVHLVHDVFAASHATAWSLLIATNASLLAITFFNWRCPTCKQHPGRSITQRSCAHCGVSLR